MSVTDLTRILVSDALLTQIKSYVVRQFTEHPRPELVYHTLAHTEDVVQAAGKIAHHYELPDNQRLVVLAAAWFHDLGYLSGSGQDHEEKSAEIAASFLQSQSVSADQIRQVQACIRATKLPQHPTNLLEEIMCDADLWHLGSDTFREQTKLLRKEQEQLTGREISGAQWRQGNISFLSTHRYFTPYAQKHLDKGREANLEQLRQKEADKKEKQAEIPIPDLTNPEAAPTDPITTVSTPFAPSEKKKKKDDKPERGVETMFRTTSTNHLRLSEIADSKANIMISVNSIMVSVLVSVLAPRIENHPHLMPPTLIFVTTALLTIVFAVLATRPNVTQGRFSKEDIQNKKANLLFFGNFYNMTLDDYEWGVKTMMDDSDFLYSSMTRDIYFLGVVLSKKYKLLRIAYNIFMFGFVVSILAFVGTFLIYEK
ncbi:Pycsar system effector family protein [Spirosoma koreense]